MMLQYTTKSVVDKTRGGVGSSAVTLTCWKRAFLCLGLPSSMETAAVWCAGGSSSGCGKLVLEASKPLEPPTFPPALPPPRLALDPDGDEFPCEPFPQSTLPSPEALFLTQKSLAGAFVPRPPLPSIGFTYKFDESSQTMSPSEGKGCVRHDANVSAM